MVILDRSIYINAAEETLSDTSVHKKLKGRQQLTYRINRLNLIQKKIQSTLPAAQNGTPSFLLKPFIINEPSSQSITYAYFLFKAHKSYSPLKF